MTLMRAAGQLLAAESSVRVLLIAYEFPPSPSPQSLRWAYLARELQACGVEVHVLTAQSGWSQSWVGPSDGVLIHRTPHWSFASLVAMARHRYRMCLRRAALKGDQEALPRVAPATRTDSPSPAFAFVPQPGPVKLNWKGRLVQRIQVMADARVFPDERGHWLPTARARLRDLLRALDPDVVISSHEPATTLQLGRLAKQKGFPWIADLGDPVLSFYTPARWRRKSARIERWTCRHADHVTVTTEAARQLLAARHAAPESRFSVLTQGYDGRAVPVPAPDVEFDPGRLELLYTGSFYTFRQAQALVEAVLGRPGVRLTIASSRVPDWLNDLHDAHSDSLRLVGFLPHAQCLGLQQAADVLVNIANDDPVHVPGKVFEYLGAGKPILHLGDFGGDVAAQLIRSHSRGLVSGNDPLQIDEALATLEPMKRDMAWDSHFELGRSGVEIYQWQHLGRRLLEVLKSLQKSGSGAPGAPTLSRTLHPSASASRSS